MGAFTQISFIDISIFVPRLFHACYITLTFSSYKQFVDGYHADSEIYSEAVHSFPVAVLYGPTVVLTNGTDNGKPKTVAFRSL